MGPVCTLLQCKLAVGCVPFELCSMNGSKVCQILSSWISPLGSMLYRTNFWFTEPLFCSPSMGGGFEQLLRQMHSWVVSGLMSPVVLSSQSLHAGYTTPVSFWSDFCHTAWLLSWSAHNRLPRESTGFISHFQPSQVGTSESSITRKCVTGWVCYYLCKVLVDINIKSRQRSVNFLLSL